MSTIPRASRPALIREILAVESKPGRQPIWDVLRGVAIVLVVVGHITQYYATGGIENPVFRFIYSFHMPLFMFVSGILAKTTFAGRPNALSNKALVLVAPFVSWAILHFAFEAVSNLYSGGKPDWIYFANLVRSPDYGLWFLWVLFLCFVLLDWCSGFAPFDWVAWAVVYVTLRILDEAKLHGFLGSSLLVWQMPYFALGAVFPARFQQHFLKRHLGGILALVLFGATWPFWRKSGVPTFFDTFKIPPLTWACESYNFVVSITGSLACVYIVSRALKWIEWLAPLGMISLEIYCCHMYFLTGHPATLWGFSLTFIYCVMATLCCVGLIKQSALLNLILFGRRAKPLTRLEQV